MVSFFERKSYSKKLLEHSGDRVHWRPDDLIFASTHSALVQLMGYFRNNYDPELLQLLQQNAIISLQQNAIEQNDPLSQFVFGMLQLEGLSDIVPQDIAFGRSLIELAASQEPGCYFANLVLGSFYMQGNDFVDRDLLQAHANFLKALQIMPDDIFARKNLLICCLKLGEYYLKQATVLDSDNILEQIRNKQQNNRIIPPNDNSTSVDFKPVITRDKLTIF
jgi:hypothetical protein